MGQVPKYGIVGSGRMARHWCHYLELLHIPYQQWSRQTGEDIAVCLVDCNPIILLISDTAIETFIQSQPFLQRKKLVHFSGALVSELAYSAHPLMTFSHDLYPLATYQAIPFIIEQTGPSLKELLPGIPNPSQAINKELKPLYHALCVMSGNFTIMLWEKVYAEFETRFNISRQLVYPYLRQTMHNLQQATKHSVLTGPLVRGDNVVINSHLQALAGDPFQTVYQAFVQAYSANQQHRT